MKVPYGKIKNALKENRIFLGEQTLDGASKLYSDDQLIEIPSDFSSEPYCTYFGKNGSRLASMGSFSYTRSMLPVLISSIGRYTSIGNGLQVLGDRHPLEWISTSPAFYTQNSGIAAALEADTGNTLNIHPFAKNRRSIVIGNDVWIGQNVTLAQGITIGDGAVVAGNTLVVKDVPPYTIVGGNPGKPIKPRFSDHIVDALISLQWWQYSAQDISRFDVSRPYVFCQQLMDSVINGRISLFNPRKISKDDLV
ncbi:CatB-related O-acetyltransferase [Pseudomonas putida]|uniref:CatB-related O-acetyltransferase n=1 Tax=Pseudomonas putida TaxID=303 RepID=UPI00216A5C8C|nr:CatB-related O-acetyltransferase [Pseudomonas putida]MCS4065607.1 acetyltransferase-like isoleucine patch superfamily enzyme [Pseudomonas putida]